tara:strand:- start:1769 stop:2278 length:510 start_codon:yes stop_codon:yes gene_type:complete
MIESRKRSNIVPITIDPRATNALKYRPEFCKLVVDLARQGHFPEEWCTQIEISLSTMYNWATRYPEFDEACRVAWTALSAYWTGELIQAAGSNACDTKLLLELIRRRFPDTWGANAKNTFGHFISCVDAASSTRSKAPDFSTWTIDELKSELAGLRSGSGSDMDKISPD